MPNQDGWDWPFILYAGTVWLNRTEYEVWNMTPRKLFALLTVHYDIERLKNRSEKQKGLPWRTQNPSGTTFIDNIKGW